MTMQRVTRTINPLHFEDLEPHRFEDLVRQLAYGFRPWRQIEATGRLGKDEGVDVRGVEGPAMRGHRDDQDEDNSMQDDDAESPSLRERVWRIQCKRYKAIGPKLMRDIVAETVPDAEDVPYGVVVAAACDVSAETMAAFREECLARGIVESHLWTKAHLEDLLFRPENDGLLFAYFGISLTVRRRSRLQHIRDGLVIKRKLMRGLGVENVTDRLYQEILIRDVEDTAYPYEDEVEGFSTLNPPPWKAVKAYAFHPHYLLVSVNGYEGWVRPTVRGTSSRHPHVSRFSWVNSRRSPRRRRRSSDASHLSEKFSSKYLTRSGHS